MTEPRHDFPAEDHDAVCNLRRTPSRSIWSQGLDSSRDGSSTR